MKHYSDGEIKTLIEEKAEYYKRLPEDRRAMAIPFSFTINSMEGLLTGKPGDFIIEGHDGEFYICDGKIFKKTYKKIRLKRHVND